MKLILDSKMEHELIDRFTYMYDVFHTYMFVNKKTTYYIESKSFPEKGLEYTFIIGHNSFVIKYLSEHIIDTETLIIITCGAKKIANLNLKNIVCSKIYIAKTKNYFLNVYSGNEVGFNFDITESELDLYNNREKIDKIELSFELIKGELNNGNNNKKVRRI